MCGMLEEHWNSLSIADMPCWSCFCPAPTHSWKCFKVAILPLHVAIVNLLICDIWSQVWVRIWAVQHRCTGIPSQMSLANAEVPLRLNALVTGFAGCIDPSSCKLRIFVAPSAKPGCMGCPNQVQRFGLQQFQNLSFSSKKIKKSQESSALWRRIGGV